MSYCNWWGCNGCNIQFYFLMRHNFPNEHKWWFLHSISEHIILSVHLINRKWQEGIKELYVSFWLKGLKWENWLLQWCHSIFPAWGYFKFPQSKYLYIFVVVVVDIAHGGYSVKVSGMDTQINGHIYFILFFEDAILFIFHQNTWHLRLHYVRLHRGLAFQRQIDSGGTELLSHKT